MTEAGEALTPPLSQGEREEGVVIDVQGLTKRFGDRTAVDGLTLQVRRGEIYGFLGPNGSGKTTSIRMMCGLLTPDGGAGRTLGLDVVRQARQIKQRVGYMTQRFGLYDDLTIAENLDFVARVYGVAPRRERVRGALIGAWHFGAGIDLLVLFAVGALFVVLGAWSFSRIQL